MKILILNGTPRKGGNTQALVNAFTKGAEDSGHEVKEIDVYHKNVHECMGCEYCHKNGNGACIQNDDMAEIAAAINEAELLVYASPVYFFNFTGPLSNVLHRTYSFGFSKNLKYTALILSSGSDGVYDPIIEQCRMVDEFWKTENIGILTAHGAENKSEAKLEEAYQFGRNMGR